MSLQASYRQLGKSGLRVSVPILGGMTFGSQQWSPWVLGEENGMALLKAAWDLGINTIDTANSYSNGASEEMIGAFIKKYNIPRENLVLMTKIGFVVPKDPSVLAMLQPQLSSTRDYVNQGGLSRAAIFSQVEASLSRLGTSYIDLLQIHLFDPTTPVEETMRALHDLVSLGQVRYLGACNLRAWQLAEMNGVAERNGWTTFVATQVEHSLLYHPYEAEIFAYASYKGIGILGFSPLMDGHLARPLDSRTPRTECIAGTFFEKARSDSDKKIIARVEELAGRKCWKMSQVALAWSAGKTSSPIVGANTPERLADTILGDKELSLEEVQYLEELYEEKAFRW